MAMRSQLYEWKQSATIVDIQSSIFIGGTGNNITKPAETTATQFAVIEMVASTPSNPDTYITGIQNYMQVRINTTDYFLDPDNKPNDGIPGAASHILDVLLSNLRSLYILMCMSYPVKFGIA